MLDARERQRTIDQALLQMDKQFGKGAVLRMGSRTIVPVDVIPTGSLSLDSALGVGGFPRGRVVEVFGPESSGKTTLALHVIAEAQREGGTAVFVDAEHALDAVYAGFEFQVFIGFIAAQGKCNLFKAANLVGRLAD